MQIRLTVLAPRSGQSSQGATRASDVLVTAPAGTALAAVASALAAAASGPEAPSSGTVVLYAGRERLDSQRCALGEPPLVDGAVLSLHTPGEDEAADDEGAAERTQLHVVGGPDAGGVHLLHEGRIRIGRAAEADVPLDDPDVSRLHCEVTVAGDGGVTVADLGSTNGTTLDGAEVGRRPVRLGPGALLRIGESTLRLAASQGSAVPPAPGPAFPPAPGSGAGASAPGTPAPDSSTHGGRPVIAPDGEGHLRVRRPASRPAPAGDLPDRVPSWARERDAAERAADFGEASPPASLRGDGGPFHGRADAWGPELAAGVRGGHGAAPAAGAGGQPGQPGEGGSDRADAGGQPGQVGAERAARRGPRLPGGSSTAPGTGPGSTGRGTPTATARLAGVPYGEERAPGGGIAYGEDRGPDPAGHGGHGRDGGHGAGASDAGPAGRAPYGDQPGIAARIAPGLATRGALPATDGVPYGGDLAPGTGAPYGRGSDAAPGGHGGHHAGASATRAAARTPYGTAPDRTPASGATTHGTGVADGLGAGGGGPAGPDTGRGGRRRRGIGAWARRLAGGRDEPGLPGAGGASPPGAAEPTAEIWPDPAAVLLTALGPGPRLWERDARHPESLVVRLGTADRADTPAVPVTVGLRESGSLGLAGPRCRLMGLARSVIAQAAALHSPADLEIVLISTDRARPLEERKEAWGWLGWLPHLRPAHGQECRLLLAYDRDQATARTAELTRRLDDGPLGPGWPSAERRAVEMAAARHTGPRTLVVLDGDPGSAALRETTARLAEGGAAAGIHLVCLAETPPASPLSPVAATYEEACAASPAFRECGAVGLLSGDVATALRLLRTAAGHPAGHGTVAAVDGVSAAWAERFGRALAPLRADGEAPAPGRAAAPLPRSARLLDELGLARATPASLMARWASSGPGTAVLGAGPGGPVAVDLTSEDPHLLIEGPAGSGRTELLRTIAASLAAGGRPDRLGLLLVDGAGGERGEGLSALTELPHVAELLVASDPLRMREFAQALGAELKRRAELLGREAFEEWHTRREVAERLIGQRPPSAAEARTEATAEARAEARAESGADVRAETRADARGDLESPPSRTLRLRPAGGRSRVEATQAAEAAQTEAAGRPGPLPRLVVLVDDYDALVAPALGSPGRPAAGSVVRALEAVARDGRRLGVHLVATSARPDRTADGELAHGTRLRVVLEAPPVAPGPGVPAPGRGRLARPDGSVTPFQGGRVTGRIPRTATLRPTVVELAWERMGDPPARRPVRELGNGPTDLALLASALDRAARSVDAAPVPPLTPTRP
ncbi:FtsK/SpoIIIE domain-containing protein [Streptomyces sp. I6]|uniref:FtsK/SpoIIIE domain-containing protein n=1 Tax=Streptomyces sp. I6 TaxID=2483113 RepID=UPI000F44919B|nr:FtsK/SpoIIIE domain-containing protein [Streptomyces sp. I6]RNL71352.1 FHA domain-containing protein [Streptomyces sp. I6]